MNEYTKTRVESIIEDLAYYLKEFENAEKTAKDANISIDEVIKNTKKALFEIAEKW